MKKDKWLSLALLMTLSGSYLTPSLALAEAANQPPASSQATEQPKEDKNHNGIPDEEEDDNHNGIPDFEEDYNHNGTPDFKEPKAEEEPSSSSSSQPQASQDPEAPQAPAQSSQPEAAVTPAPSQEEASKSDKSKKSKTTKKSTKSKKDKTSKAESSKTNDKSKFSDKTDKSKGSKKDSTESSEGTKSSSSDSSDKSDKETKTDSSSEKSDDSKTSDTKSSETKSTETKPSASLDQAASKESSKDSQSSDKGSESDQSVTTDDQTQKDQSSDQTAQTQPSHSQTAKQAESQLQSIAKTPLARPGQSQVVTPSPWTQSVPESGPAYDWFGDTDDTPGVAPTYTAYVEHWSGDSAYTHNLLSHRYGIKAEQLDGYLNSLNIPYDRNRINGKLLLEWEKESGMDARAIIAIAIAESSLGTAGVATMPGANMFGYGAFDSNPNNATNYNDQVAVKRMTKDTIIGHKNWTFKVQDDKAKKAAAGQLSPDEGGVYYTDTSGTGKRRAKIMEDIDKWIDAHGGTPAIPKELQDMTGNTVGSVPAGFKVKTPINTSTYIAQSYPYGQCTWYVYNRAHEMGIDFDPYMGNGGDWQYKAGFKTHHEPKVGYAVSFSPGQAGADPFYGHVAIVEDVKEDGSILISESNAKGLGVVSYRTFTAAQARNLTYVEGHK